MGRWIDRWIDGWIDVRYIIYVLTPGFPPWPSSEQPTKKKVPSDAIPSPKKLQMPWLESKLAEVTKMAGACRCLKKWPLFGMMMPSGNYLRDWNHQWDNEPFYPTCETPKSRDPWDSIPELNEGFLWRSIIMCGDNMYIYIFIFIYASFVWCLSTATLGQRHTWNDWKHRQESLLKKMQYYCCRLRKAILEVDRQHH